MTTQLSATGRLGVPGTILLSGVPATGKSTFGNWLSVHHGFLHVDVEHAGSDPVGVRRAWITALSAADPEPLVKALITTSRPVVIDWGYLPGFLPFVRSLHDAGLTAWWFDGDVAAARSRFVERGTGSVSDFDQQMARIEAARPLISEFYADRIVRTLDASGRFERWEVVRDRVMAGTSTR